MFGLGASWNTEYGSADDPEQLPWLLAYSPYHHVRDAVAYPAVLFTVFDGDTRVDPMHARKMCAALQAATTADRPILLRTEKDVGHGARAVSRSVALSADTMAFAAAWTGRAPPRPPGPPLPPLPPLPSPRDHVIVRDHARFVHDHEQLHDHGPSA
jgi:prolyl oligopeptidase